VTRRRVILAINSLECGGAEQQVVRLATHLHQIGDTVLVVTLLPGDHHRRTLESAGIPAEVLTLRGPLRGVSAVLAARKCVRSWRPDVVVSFLYQSNVVWRLACSGTDVPVVSSIRNERFGGSARELALRLTDPLARRTVVNSALTGESLADRRVVDRARLVVVPNGLESSALDLDHADRVATREALGVGAGQFLWLGIGRLQPQKDWPTLLRAVAALEDDERLEQRWFVAGDGPQLDELQREVRRLGVGDVVTFLGQRNDVPQLLAAADGLVLASRHEGLPNVVLEAMAARRPVVATRVGGVPELIEDEVTGRLVAAGDPADLARAMLWVARASSTERAAMGEAGRAIVESRYSVKAAMDEWDHVLAVAG
jgi:glycosyltransferase involved in cell wall biosynthesis